MRSRRFEDLEPRHLLATYVVQNTMDSGPGSLREAIQFANDDAAHDDIEFDIDGDGVHRISPASPLPAIVYPVTIDGYSQCALTDRSCENSNPIDQPSNAVIQVELDGSQIDDTTTPIGLQIETSAATIRGLSIGRFGIAIGVVAADSVATGQVAIEGNYIGTDATGLVSAANLAAGIALDFGSQDVRIGGGNGDRNIISSNGVGVIAGGTGHSIDGNFIGINATGDQSLPNQTDGITVLGSMIKIGGVDTANRNVISGNEGNGVTLEGSNNEVQGNYIGLTASGQFAIPNGGDGVSVVALERAVGNSIGGELGVGGNVISGNGRNGVAMAGPGVAQTFVGGNLIGVDVTGELALGNEGYGVRIHDAADNLVGGYVETFSDNSQLANASNVISGNALGGVLVSGDMSLGNAVQNNRIGTNSRGSRAVPNLGHGVEVVDAVSTRVGGYFLSRQQSIEAGNVISGNLGDGVFITGTGDLDTSVRSNHVGTDVNGVVGVGNQGVGVRVVAAEGSDIGGPAINSDLTLLLDGGNLIAGNGSHGISIVDVAPDVVGMRGQGASIHNNYVGISRDGEREIPNARHGINVQFSKSIMIGGVQNMCDVCLPPLDEPFDLGNTVAFNGGIGVRVQGSPDNNEFGGFVGTSITRNRIFSNAGLGIDLIGMEGVDPNDDQDPDPGPNRLQNYPVLTEVALGSPTVVSGFINSTPLTNLTIQFFANDELDASMYGEGKRLLRPLDPVLDAIEVDTDEMGVATFADIVLDETFPGEFVTATATDAFTGETSEFSLAAPFGDITGVTFDDLNGNGLRDDDDPPLGNVVVHIVGDWDGSGAIDFEASTVSDPTTGEYRFSPLPSGSYTISFEVPDGRVATTTSRIIQVGDTSERVDVDGGSFAFASVRGSKFDDRNANGVRDFGEPGLADWQIELTLTSPDGATTILPAMTTDDNGHYEFDDLGPGVVQIQELEVGKSPNWHRTLPSDVYEFALTSGGSSNADFGNYFSVPTGNVAGATQLSRSGDLLVLNDYKDAVQGSGELALFTGTLNGDTLFVSPADTPLPTNSRPKAAVFGDANEDGQDDFVAVASYGNPEQPSAETNGLFIYEYENGSLSDAGQLILQCSSFQLEATTDRCDGPHDVDAAAITASGPTDLLVTANLRSNTITVLMGDPSNGFSQAVQTIPVGDAPTSVRFGQLNPQDDNFTDIVVANYDSNSVMFLLGDGQGQFLTPVELVGFDKPSSLLLHDLNGDGADDLVVANFMSGTVSVLTGPSFATRRQFATGLGPRSIAAGDLNGDGIDDLAVANADSGTVSVLLGDGSGQFPRRIDFGLPPIENVNPSAGHSPYSVRIGNFDGRGRLDLVVAHFLGGYSVHLNGVDDGNISVPAATALELENAEIQRDDRLDIDGDGIRSPLDALLVINHLNQGGVAPQASLTRLDVDRDGWVTPLDALQVINDLNKTVQSAPLSSLSIDSLVASAISYWVATGISSKQADVLRSTDIVLADLPGRRLATVSQDLVLLDATAAGRGWYVDPNPEDHGEFSRVRETLFSAAWQEVDLLTVLMHEFGHILGAAHDPSGQLMSSTLDVGQRKLPARSDVDQIMANWQSPRIES